MKKILAALLALISMMTASAFAEDKLSIVCTTFVEEHILCHKGAYTGKSGITRDRTGKPWYYRNLKR